ncbi:MAG: hypothetical protein HS115_18645 [Spirochaetales bacterium]|nr:hypothetical protein [Spirochaetales bacterium]
MPSAAVNHYHYRYRIGWIERALAIASWTGNLLPGGFLLSFALYDRFRDRFVRRHALLSGMLGLIWSAMGFAAYLLNYLFLYESSEQFLSYEQLLGGLFSSGPWLPVLLIVLQSFLFMQHVRMFGPSGQRGQLPLLLSLSLPFFYYNKALWAPVMTGDAVSFFAFDYQSFRSPLSLFPGHYFALLMIWGALQALQGLAPVFWRKLFCRLLRDERARAGQRMQPALLRAFVPGWGFFYLGQRLSGAGFFLFFLLISFLFSLSLALNYGDLVQNWPGFNANAAWYYLSTLGLKSAISDAHLKSWLGHPLSLGGTFALFVLSIVLSRILVARQFRSGRPGLFWSFVPSAALLHLFIPVMALLIPVRFHTLEPPPENQAAEPPAIPVIPHFFEESQDMGLDGSVLSGRPDGDDRDPLLAEKKAETQGEGPEANTEESTGLSTGEGRGVKGDRSSMTYSNYLSARLRVAESWLRYWDQVPQPYAAVFSYRISENGVVENVSIVDPSSAAQADHLTVQLIESMGVLLPPPGGPVRVTELFWNTTPDDSALPTELKRQLSKAFDGRTIERD